MGFLKPIINGAVLGLTESLPVSGTGHALLMGHIFEYGENFRTIFFILHIGILIAIIFAYHKKIFELIKSSFVMVKNIITGQFRLESAGKYQNMLMALIIGLVPMFLIFVPVIGSGTNVFGIAREFFDSDNIILVGASFLLNGMLLKLGVNNLKSDKFKYTYKTADNVVKRWDGRMRFTIMDALWCGVFQFISMIFPGGSHVGMVFSIGIIKGINRQLALEYSFLMGISPIIIFLTSEFLFAKKCTDFLFNDPAIWLGILCSAVFGFLFIKVFNRLVKKNRILVFSIYTIFLGFAVIILGIFEQIKGINLFSGKTL